MQQPMLSSAFLSARTPPVPPPSPGRNDRFHGDESSGSYEIEKIEAFHRIVRNKDLSTLSMRGWIFQEVDFSHEPMQNWNAYNFDGAVFWGCKYPPGVTSKDVRNKGADVLDNPANVPYKIFRAFMYSQPELIANDKMIYQHYLTHNDMRTKMAHTLHDYCISDALYDYIQGKTPVGIMGGNGMKRASTDYKNVVYLARSLARAGFLVATGGGPGAMEAANFGAYLAAKTDGETEEALALIAEGNEKYEHECDNVEAVQKVYDRFGCPTHMPSLGIPTFRYGHEAPNRFATWQAKFFQNALREESIIAICSGGLIFTPGSAGTRQEIFQTACQNHYPEQPDVAVPMVFFPKIFWGSPPNTSVVNLLEETSRGKTYHDWLLTTDNQNEIVQHLLNHAKLKGLPLIENLDSLKPIAEVDEQ